MKVLYLSLADPHRQPDPVTQYFLGAVVIEAPDETVVFSGHHVDCVIIEIPPDSEIGISREKWGKLLSAQDLNEPVRLDGRPLQSANAGKSQPADEPKE